MSRPCRDTQGWQCHHRPSVRTRASALRHQKHTKVPTSVLMKAIDLEAAPLQNKPAEVGSHGRRGSLAPVAGSLPAEGNLQTQGRRPQDQGGRLEGSSQSYWTVSARAPTGGGRRPFPSLREHSPGAMLQVSCSRPSDNRALLFYITQLVHALLLQQPQEAKHPPSQGLHLVTHTETMCEYSHVSLKYQ